ncbi:MAG: hypothetical protein IT307_12285 [Chloroflexi bacterium]|nr:hypothetical protein [Chloroflexota bacterium]
MPDDTAPTGAPPGRAPVRIGVIADRHVMPVDQYLVERVRPGQSAYDEVLAACERWLSEHPEAGVDGGVPLEVFYSGLTEATMAVADALHNNGRVNARLMRFDIVLQSYESLRRHQVPCQPRTTDPATGSRG